MIPTVSSATRGLLCALAFIGSTIGCGCASSNAPPSAAPLEAEPSSFAGISPLDVVAPSCADGSSRDIELDEVTDAGFSAEDLLANIEGMHEAKLIWASPEEVTIGPESGEHTLRILVERASERAKLFDPDTDAIGHGARCPLWVAVDVVVSLQSDDLALNEEVHGTVYARDARLGYFQAEAGSASFGGELTVSLERGALLSRFELAMTLSEHGATGSLHAVRLTIQETFSYEEPVELAYFGHVRCEVGAQSLQLDELVQLNDGDRVSASSAAGAVGQLSSVSITWPDGTTAAASFSFTGDPNGACLQPSPIAPDGYTVLALHGMVELRSEDERLDARWPVYLQATGSSYQVTLDTLGMPMAATATPAELGFPMQSRDDLDAISVDLNIQLVPPSEVSGDVRLNGFDCGAGDPNDPTVNCEFTSTLLEAGTLGP
jgi:hypothetical protein